jgi:hypothetical protein
VDLRIIFFGAGLIGTISLFEAVGAASEDCFVLETTLGFGVGLGLAVRSGVSKRSPAKTKVAMMQTAGVLSFMRMKAPRVSSSAMLARSRIPANHDREVSGKEEVLGGGLEPPCLAAYAPQTYVSAISPPELWEAGIEDGRWKMAGRKCVWRPAARFRRDVIDAGFCKLPRGRYRFRRPHL